MRFEGRCSQPVVSNVTCLTEFFSFFLEFNQELEDEGFTADCASALGFKFINQDQLWETLKNFKDYDGLILTSQRSVQAIQKVIEIHKGIQIFQKYIVLLFSVEKETY